MTALLNALDPARRRRTPIIVGAALLVTAGAAASVAYALASKEPASCPDPKAQLAGAWDGGVKTKLAAQFAALGKMFADDVWKLDAPRLEAYATKWAAMHAASCKATRVDRTQSPDVMEARSRCLDRRLSALRGLTTALAAADTKLAIKLPNLVDGLPSLDDCSDVERLTAYPLPTGDAARKAIAEIGAEHDRARATRLAGDIKQALVIIDAAIERARQVDHPPALLEVLLVGAAYHDGAGKGDEATALLRDAIQVAARAKDDKGAAKAWAMLLHTLGDGPRTHEEAKSIEQAAAAASVRAGEPPEVAHTLLMARANLAVGDQRLADALTFLQDAAAVEGATDAAHEEAINNMAKLLYMMGRAAEALPVAEDALARARVRSGPSHPWVGDALALVAQIQGAQGLDDAAEATALQALSIRRAAYGDDHPYTAETLQTLANIEARRKAYPKAIELIGQVIAIREKLPDKDGLASAIGMLAVYTDDSGDHAGAIAQFQRALKVYEETGAVASRQYFETAMNLADALVEDGDCTTATPIIDKVVAGFEKQSPAKLPMPLILRGQCQDRADDDTAAVATYERAYALCKEAECGAAGIVLSAWPLGKLLASTGGDRKRARELVLEAREIIVAADAKDDLKMLDAWLKKH